MTDSRSVFAGSIPEFYDRFFGPVLFEPYAADMARRVAEGAGRAVLETACGTGILTRRLRERLPAEVRLVATDLNQPMLDYAQAKLASLAGIEWQQADCTALPFPEASFSALVCQFGAMFVPDKAAIFGEARRVLSDGGLLAFSVWGSLAENHYAEVVQETIGSFFRGDPPRFFDVPHGFGDEALWAELVRTQSFGEPRLEWLELEAQSPTAEQLAIAMVRGTPMSNAIRERGGDFEQIVAAVTEALARLGGAAPFRAPMRALFVTARA
jgi:ubiquinone/menaquinone biosynthesis C-methylase UbiE